MRVRYHLLCVALIIAPAALAVLAIVAGVWLAGCGPRINPPHGCNPNSEITCVGGGCCTQGVEYCQQPDDPPLCPAGMCCPVDYPIIDDTMRKPRPQRRP